MTPANIGVAPVGWLVGALALQAASMLMFALGQREVLADAGLRLPTLGYACEGRRRSRLKHPKRLLPIRSTT